MVSLNVGANMLLRVEMVLLILLTAGFASERREVFSRSQRYVCANENGRARFNRAGRAPFQNHIGTGMSDHDL
jgi:hypothetical protein